MGEVSNARIEDLTNKLIGRVANKVDVDKYSEKEEFIIIKEAERKLLLIGKKALPSLRKMRVYLLDQKYVAQTGIGNPIYAHEFLEGYQKILDRINHVIDVINKKSK